MYMQEINAMYIEKLKRKEKRLQKLQEKDSDFSYEMLPNVTVQLNVLQAEVRLLKEVKEDVLSLNK
ncbi:hypothetical protein [Bacillus subtilis]|uniref:hypothetical protein n=1 Tax=Bacillus subtilis TaxID=1423 RepID=UPI000EF2853B|nr:hypothetical protein [Bacillus subtilis]AYK63080.1 hypothetical protein D9C14_17730 [Bacillus subtilis subsp. subtilis]MCL8467991.1 hypothetical protein [Bacillus subtilis]MEC1806858.1 hypothetical protein [Bacillus subtilis]CAF1916704.1 hypothetical protein NRS6206_03892 [Bacillus subtilis]